MKRVKRIIGTLCILFPVFCFDLRRDADRNIR